MLFMIVSAAALVIVLMLLVIVSAAALMVVMMFMLFMIVSAAALVIVLMLFMVMMTVLMYMSALRAYLFFHHLLLQGYRIFHYLKKLLSVQIFNRCGNDSRFFVQTAEKLHGLHCLLFIHNVCSAHDNGSCILYLVVKELTKVSHIHFAFFGIYHCCIAVQRKTSFFLDILHSADHVRKLTYA